MCKAFVGKFNVIMKLMTTKTRFWFVSLVLILLDLGMNLMIALLLAAGSFVYYSEVERSLDFKGLIESSDFHSICAQTFPDLSFI